MGEAYKMESGNRRNLYLVTLSVSMAMVTLGVASGWPTVVLPKYKNNETKVDINKDSTATMLSLIPVGFAVGSLSTGYIADKFGRRTIILASALPFIIGSIVITFAVKAWQVCITSFSWSCGTGMVSTVVNYYFSEIADKNVRATLSLITGFMFKLGNLLAMSAGPFLSYEALNYILLALPIIYGVACWWIPETPYFLLRNDNVDGARKSLRILREYNDEKVLEEELLALQANVKNEMKHSSSVQELFLGPQYRKALIIGAGLKITQMLTGAVVIRQYLGWIMDETKLKMEQSVVIIIYAAITFVVSLMSSVLVDRVGRRPLLVYSYMGTGASLAIVGIYFFLQEVVHVSFETLTTLSFMPLAGIILSNVVSTLGFSSLIFIIPAEIFPMNVKAIAMTCLGILGCVLGFVISLAYQRIKDFCGLAVVFWIFAAFAFFGGAFCYFLVPETKGKDLREIQAELQGASYNAVVVDDKLENVVTNNDENKEATEMEELNKKESV
ncbi:hypothetical protein PYW07_017260 [Mythimna separata]|uniref:Major facilitator superfamily (MFS) profile domain-containing protein n=1 Tax=Mythimna separata TaxID=271217 RepID=A0AAD7YXS4_MYTSE|nr:hypothetical protein PYW07_017260 [Mythimna separata]